MREKISATIITRNEEQNIEKCLNSLLWVDEIVVVDSHSQDKTVDICKSKNCKIILTDWLGFGATKAFAVDSAANNWILSIDADEIVSEELKKDILKLLENPKFNSYLIKRKSYYLGKLINYCGWNNDYPLRLFNKQFGNFNNKSVHESVIIEGERGKLLAPIFHFTYPTISSHINKINRYSQLAAEALINSEKKYSVTAALFFGLNKFLKMYFLKFGFLDGREGFLLCFNSAIGVYLKYIKTWKRKL